MSKSIYEEALKESKDFGSMIGLKLDKVNNALKQAQKQERLLELYKEVITVKDNMKDNIIKKLLFVDSDYYTMEKKETYLEKQIKELEK